MHTYNAKLERLACPSSPLSYAQRIYFEGASFPSSESQQLLLFDHAASVLCLPLYCVILPAFYLFGLDAFDPVA